MPADTSPAALHASLLAHRDWVRALARSLTSRAEDADDVEQQTWLAALAYAPGDVRSMRAWLVTVARNAARKLRRGDARRRRREDAVPPRATHESAAALAERAEVHSRVVAAVVALDEPYREAILLRYFEGLPVNDVAARTGVPLETARARLRRARALLQGRLERDLGPERPWRAALVLLADPGAPPTPVGPGGAPPATGALLGGTLVTAKTTAALVCVAVLAVLLVWRPWSGDRSAGPSAPDTSANPPVAATVPATRPRARAEPPATQRVAEPAPAPASARKSGAAPAPSVPERLAGPLDDHDPTLDALDFSGDDAAHVFGRLADVCGCTVVVTEAASRKFDAQRMRLGTTVPWLAGVTPGARAFLTLAAIAGVESVVQEERVVLAAAGETVGAKTVVTEVPHPERRPPVLVRGRVLGPDGSPVAGAEIFRSFGVERRIAVADAAGCWEAERRTAPSCEVWIFARAPGRIASLAVRLDPAASPTPQRIDLTLGEASGAVTVRVTSGDTPLEGADVVVGSVSQKPVVLDGGGTAVRMQLAGRTDARGEVTIDGVPPGRPAVAVALRGFTAKPAEAVVAAGETAILTVQVERKSGLADRVASTRTSLAFDSAAPGNVVAFLSKVHGLNIVILPRLAERAARTTVTLNVRDEPLPSVLRSLCDQMGGAVWEVREEDGVVVLDAPTEPAPAPR